MSVRGLPEMANPDESSPPFPDGNASAAAGTPAESIWSRIKRHKVVEWTLAYVAFAYALLHGVQMLRETFEWPLVVSRLTVVALVLGAPVAVTLAWYHGHRARHRVSGPELSILIALLVIAGSVLWWVSRLTHESAGARPPVELTSNTAHDVGFRPPPHSIAVLPFVNMSADKEQEYFSDGLTEELLNSLAEINELQVAARTSAFSFKGTNTDISVIARKLNVAVVLEGSVRRSGNTVRISTQLINAVTGFHLWSHTYDRNLGDVLKLESEIANAVANALKLSLLGDVATKIELGGTRNSAAFDAYLRGRKAYLAHHSGKDVQTAIAAFTEAIELDPNYALAFANRSLALSFYAEWMSGRTARESFDKAPADALKAIALAPDLAEGHLALAHYFVRGSLDFTRGNEELERALALAPSNAEVLLPYSGLAVSMGRIQAGITAARRAIVLDPRNSDSHSTLGWALYLGRKYQEAPTAFQDALAIDPEIRVLYGWRGIAYYALGDLERARASCESKPDYWASQWCLAVVYDKLGRRADAEANRTKMMAAQGDDVAYQCAEIYAQWGNSPKALEWLETALRIRNPDLELLKTDPLMDPLRKEPRFQAIERALKFPN